MGWGRDAEELVFKMFTDRETEKAIVAKVRKQWNPNDKSTRRCIAGLDLIKTSGDMGPGSELLVEPNARFERLNGTKHYLSDLSRSWAYYKNKTGLPPGARTPAVQAEVSGRWPDLRKVAIKLQHLAQGGVPIPQLLGFPWGSSPFKNSSLSVDHNGFGFNVRLESENNLLLDSLREHLSDEPIWDRLDEWRKEVGASAAQLNLFNEYVVEQPEIRDRKVIHWLHWTQGRIGITEFFPKSIASELTEKACGGLLSHDTFEIEQHVPQKTWVLRWHRDSSSFVRLASGETRQEMEGLENLHGSIAQRVQRSSQIEMIAEKYASIEEMARSVTGDLQRIGNLTSFPRACDLCKQAA